MAEEAYGEDEESVRRRIEDESKGRDRRGAAERSPKGCRPIYDRLSTPNRRLILALYQNHAYHLPEDKVERIKERLQEMYAMTPEETERYFQELMERSCAAARRRIAKRLLRKEYARRRRREAAQRAYRFAEKTLRLGMTYSYYNPVPPLVSVRLRNLSNVVLEQLCDLRNVDIPPRDAVHAQGAFLVSLSDWLAIAIETVYYRVQLRKNKELEEIGREKEKPEAQRKGSPVQRTATTGGEGERDEEEAQEKYIRDVDFGESEVDELMAVE